MSKPNLVERAHDRAAEISAAIARNNQGIDLELLAEILSELRRMNEREEAPGFLRRSFSRLKRKKQDENGDVLDG